MKKIFLPLFIVALIISASSCDILKEKNAEMILDGSLTRTYTSNNDPCFQGYVKNVGNTTGYNCKIEIRCYSDTNGTTIIDTAIGFPADQGDIDPGQRASFEAVAFNVDNHDEIKSVRYDLTWLDRK